MPLEFNCGYHICVLYIKDINHCLKSESADKLSAKLRQLINVWQKNFYYAQKLQEQAHNWGFKPKSYFSRNKVWLNCKYIKTKYI